MRILLRSLEDGFRSLARGWGLVLLVLASNLGLALMLAVPFAFLVERNLAHAGAAGGMMYGFDYDWWSRWDAQAHGFAADFAPDLVGTGFAFRDLDLLLRGRVPAGLFGSGPGPAPSILGLGLLYWLLQVFLGGGLLAALRAGGVWTTRGFVHSCGFYFGRLLRVSLLALAAAGLVFALAAPLAGRVDGLAREVVSERTALALTLGRRVALLLVLVLLHMLASYAKVTVVCEERRSALLAFVSSAGFCLRRSGSVLGQYLAVGGLGLVLLGLFAAADARLRVDGWKTQAVALALFQALMACGIALRLGLLASQLELHRAEGARRSDNQAGDRV
jgi:hypothetical protein